MHKIRNFHEGHSIVGQWQGGGRVMAGERHGNGMVCVNQPLLLPFTYLQVWSVHAPCHTSQHSSARCSR
jgi:hypothetical protein